MILLEAFRTLLQRGLPLRLSIVGDGVGREALREYIRQNDLASSVTLHGALSHPATRELLGTRGISSFYPASPKVFPLP